ncbi:unnamed protein product [Calypogeia fissa]
MNSKCVFAAMLPLAMVLLLAGAHVQSCVNFKAIEVGNNNGLLQIDLWDNGPDQCSLTGYPSYDQVYELQCIQVGYSALFDVNAQHVTYDTDHGNFGFDALGDGFSGYTACLYDCNNPGDCFV